MCMHVCVCMLTMQLVSTWYCKLTCCKGKVRKGSRNPHP